MYLVFHLKRVPASPHGQVTRDIGGHPRHDEKHRVKRALRDSYCTCGVRQNKSVHPTKPRRKVFAVWPWCLFWNHQPLSSIINNQNIVVNPCKKKMIVRVLLLLWVQAAAFLPHQPALLKRPNEEMSFLLTSSEDNSAETASATEPKKDVVKPKILEPFPEAADPKYAVRGPVGEGDFVICRTGGPTTEELSNENMLRIVKSECTDLEVNTLVWKCLGYRFNEEKEEWEATEVFPNWKERFPTPPDLIGMQRVYSREVDQPSLRSNQALVRSVPVDNKQSLKTHLKPLGWKGFQVSRFFLNHCH
jgi:hypothetical protein